MVREDRNSKQIVGEGEKRGEKGRTISLNIYN
jgi:hypothetical protein